MACKPVPVCSIEKSGNLPLIAPQLSKICTLFLAFQCHRVDTVDIQAQTTNNSPLKHEDSLNYKNIELRTINPFRENSLSTN